MSAAKIFADAAPIGTPGKSARNDSSSATCGSEFVGVRFESGLPGVCGWSGKADFARGLGEMVVRLNIATPEPTLGVFA